MNGKNCPKGYQWCWKHTFEKLNRNLASCHCYFETFILKMLHLLWYFGNYHHSKIAMYIDNIYSNCSRWKSFAVEEMNCNSLENICGCMVVLFGQSLLCRDIITDSLESFRIHWLIHETFPPRSICNCSSLCLTPPNVIVANGYTLLLGYKQARRDVYIMVFPPIWFIS